MGGHIPISPEFAANLASRAAQLYGDAEVALLARISAQLRAGHDSPVWAEQKLAAAGQVRGNLQALINELLTGPHQTLITNLITEAWEAGGAAAVADLARLPGQQRAAQVVRDLPMQQALRHLIDETLDAVGGTHVRILRSTMDTYRQVIARTSTQMLTGTQTTLQAMQSALDQLGGRGVTGFVDKAGRAWDLTSYVEMATRSAAGRAAVDGHMASLGAAGINLVVISDAPQNCRLCAPWEGKVLARSGPAGARTVEMQHSTRDGVTVRVEIAGSLEEARSSGLMHPNCRLPPLRIRLPAWRHSPPRRPDRRPAGRCRSTEAARPRTQGPRRPPSRSRRRHPRSQEGRRSQDPRRPGRHPRTRRHQHGETTAPPRAPRPRSGPLT